MFSSLVKKAKKELHQIFLPHEQNNWRPKSLHYNYLTTIVAFLLIVNVAFKFAVKEWPSNILGVSVNISTNALLNSTNAERLKYGLNPLQLNDKLNQAAAAKANDVFAKNYWAHYAPDGTSPWHWFQTSNYRYVYAGENLAKDFSEDQAVVQAWMNSETHRQNILKPEYEDIGFAVVEGVLQDQPTVLIVQLFGKEEGSALAKAPVAESEPVVKTAPESQVKTAPIKTKPVKPQVASQQFKPTQEVIKKPLINVIALQKEFLFIILAGLIVALSLDLYFVDKKKVFRLSGKNIIHLLFTLLLILSIITTGSGAIL